ncbi:MAG TPA: polymer-forming cytoskeletal protein [Calditrichia bacterium]|nr:polymer-forming cytoskeletal protein [Calditrichota bacterium]HQU74845.1 polymer-forming cytoskeletal protein [Calditrichia bacterium]HQV31952.1 polymer-forming cytoskeletal protein [Calditrichia bacterium]
MAFSGKKPAEAPVSANQLNYITAGTYFEGTIDTKGSIRIDGKVKGTIKASDEVRVGRSGEIIGEIIAKNARVAGKIQGNVTIEQKLTLESDSSLTGNLSAGRLIIDEGAFFNGNSEMGDGNGANANGKKPIFEKNKTGNEVANNAQKS